MAWDEVKTNMTVVGADLQLDEGFVEGSYEVESTDAGTLTWYDVEILLDVDESPADTGQARYQIEWNYSEDDIAWSGWELFQPGEYYLRYWNAKITVWGDPATGQRPKVTQFQVKVDPSDGHDRQPAVTSSVGALPGGPAFGDRHILTTTHSIHTCVDADTPTWRETKPVTGMTCYDTGAGASREYDGASWKRFQDRDMRFDSVGVGVAASGTTGDVSLAGVLKTGDGGTTDYTQFAADGEMTQYGTARTTQYYLFENSDFASGAVPPDEALLGNFRSWAYTINDDSVMSGSLPEQWDSSTGVAVQVAWYIDEIFGANSGEVRWNVLYSAMPTDGSEAVDAPTHTGTLDSGDINLLGLGTAKHLRISTIGTIAAGSLARDDAIGLTLKRVALVGGNNPTAEPCVVWMRLVVTSDRLGEAT